MLSLATPDGCVIRPNRLEPSKPGWSVFPASRPTFPGTLEQSIGRARASPSIRKHAVGAAQGVAKRPLSSQLDGNRIARCPPRNATR